MRHVGVAAIVPARPAAAVYGALKQFERYPEQTDAVIRARVDQRMGGRGRSSWEVRFRGGILKWREEDTFDDDARRILFRQTDGDLQHFEGRWTAEDRPEGCLVTFIADFEIGIPMLARVIEPLADEALRQHILLILSGLFNESVIPMPFSHHESGNPGTESAPRSTQ